MKVYTIEYNNGEPWEDFCKWYGNHAYEDFRMCEDALLSEGYHKLSNSEYINQRDEWGTYYAKITELNFIKRK